MLKTQGPQPRDLAVSTMLVSEMKVGMRALSLSLPPSLSHYTQHSSGKYCHSLQKGLISYPYKEINRLEDN